jgi:hypothetical protein
VPLDLVRSFEGGASRTSTGRKKTQGLKPCANVFGRNHRTAEMAHRDFNAMRNFTAPPQIGEAVLKDI